MCNLDHFVSYHILIQYCNSLTVFCSSQFKSFAYLYNEDRFMEALAKDITIVKALPPNLRGARIKKEIPSFRVPFSASPYYYLNHVLPVLTQRSVVELVVYDGGCLQVNWKPKFPSYCITSSTKCCLSVG